MIRRLSYPLQLAAVLAAIAFASSASAAECFADYKAKKDDPLRLHYGVVELKGQCSKSAARAEVAARIAKDGWKLLNVLTLFDGTKLSGKEASAGQFFLRY